MTTSSRWSGADDLLPVPADTRRRPELVALPVDTLPDLEALFTFMRDT